MNKKRFVKIVVVLSILLFGILLVFSYYLIANYERNQETIDRSSGEAPVLYRHSSSDVWDFLWLDSNTVGFISELSSISKLDITDRESEKILTTKTTYPALGLEGNELLICEWENHLRLSIEDYGTTINLYNLDGSVRREFKILDPIRPLNCSQETLLVEDSYHGSPGNFYTLDLRNEEFSIEQIDTIPTAYSVEGQEKTIVKEISTGKILFEIEKFNSFIKAVPSPDRKSVALLDYEGYLWIYQNH